MTGLGEDMVKTCKGIRYQLGWHVPELAKGVWPCGETRPSLEAQGRATRAPGGALPEADSRHWRSKSFFSDSGDCRAALE